MVLCSSLKTNVLQCRSLTIESPLRWNVYQTLVTDMVAFKCNGIGSIWCDILLPTNIYIYINI